MEQDVASSLWQASLVGDGTYLAWAASGEPGAVLCCPEDVAAAAAAAAASATVGGGGGGDAVDSGHGGDGGGGGSPEVWYLALRHSSQQRAVTAMCFGAGPAPAPPRDAAAADGDADAAEAGDGGRDGGADATWVVTASKDAVLLWHVEDAYAAVRTWPLPDVARHVIQGIYKGVPSLLPGK